MNHGIRLQETTDSRSLHPESFIRMRCEIIRNSVNSQVRSQNIFSITETSKPLVEPQLIIFYNRQFLAFTAAIIGFPVHKNQTNTPI